MFSLRDYRTLMLKNFNSVRVSFHITSNLSEPSKPTVTGTANEQSIKVLFNNEKNKFFDN